MTPVHLLAPRYVLGELAEDHTTIPNLAARAEELGMLAKPGLWGWGTVRRTTRSLEELAVETGLATLEGAGLASSDVDQLLLCSTEFPGGPATHGQFVETIMKGLGLNAAFLGVTLNRCTNLLSALGVAEAMVRSGQRARVLVVTTDRVTDEDTRMESFALFSDGAASCLVTAEPGPDGYELLGSASAQDPGALDWGNEISSDLSRVVNAELLAPRGLTLGDVKALLHNNLYKPIVVMKERQAGFAAAQLNTENTARVGHCFAADPLINLTDHADGPGHYLMASSVPGSRVGVLLKRTAQTTA